MTATIRRSAAWSRMAMVGIGALALTAALTIPVVPTTRPPGEQPVTAVAPHPAEFFDAREFALALRAIDATPARPMPGARALVIPHHWVAGSLILGALRDLAATGDVQRVVLVGPNHTNSGSAPWITSDRPWSTPFGTVEPDARALKTLTAVGVGLEPDVLTYEHSVAGIMPALRYMLPNADVVPLIIKSTVAPVDITRVAIALASLLDDPKTVIVAAVDFSHGQLEETAHARNLESRAILERMDASALLPLGNDHLDSPASVVLAIEAAQAAGATAFELRADKTSADFVAAPGGVTSYLVGYFR